MARNNTLTARAGVVFWNGPVNHSILLSYRVMDVTGGPGVLLDGADSNTGQSVMALRPSIKGTRFLELEVLLPGSGTDDTLLALGDKHPITASVRDRVELQGKRTSDPGFSDSVGRIEPGQFR